MARSPTSYFHDPDLVTRSPVFALLPVDDRGTRGVVHRALGAAVLKHLATWERPPWPRRKRTVRDDLLPRLWAPFGYHRFREYQRGTPGIYDRLWSVRAVLDVTQALCRQQPPIDPVQYLLADACARAKPPIVLPPISYGHGRTWQQALLDLAIGTEYAKYSAYEPSLPDSDFVPLPPLDPPPLPDSLMLDPRHLGRPRPTLLAPGEVERQQRVQANQQARQYRLELENGLHPWTVELLYERCAMTRQPITPAELVVAACAKARLSVPLELMECFGA